MTLTTRPRALKRSGATRIAVPSVAALATLAVVLAATAQAAPVSVPLATTESFVVLAGSGVTNTGPSTLNGDIGTFPTTSITNTGVLTVTGTDHAGDAVTQQAKTDLVAAYDAAAAQLPVQAVPVELGGLTLTPGIYSSGGELGITSTLTLDANGDPDAVFVFQTPSTLVTGTDSVVALIDGAQACNVYWQVTSSATLGVRTQFVGTIFALTSIGLDTGATVQGRLLARNGAVTLDSNTITKPLCVTAPPTASPTAAAGPTPSAAPQVPLAPRGGVSTGDGSSVQGPAGGSLGLAVLVGAVLLASATAAVRFRRARRAP